MAELLGDPAFYAAMIVVVILSAIVYFEMRFMRKRRLQAAEARMQVDDIYNQIVTSRAVSSALRGQGRNTKDADMVILEADMAYSRGNYTEARTAVERAKELLRGAQSMAAPAPAPAPVKQFESLPPMPEDKGGDECDVPFQTAKKMPKNYMESKFMICSVRDEAQELERQGRDVSLARDSLRLADEAFAREDYTEALRSALKAKKILEPREEAPPKEMRFKDLGAVEKIPPAVVVKPPVSKCEKCGDELDSGDMFCPKCGAKVERDIRCPRCANKVKVDDAYCRKCGLPLRSD